MNTNKYGVPSHQYALTLLSGKRVVIDVACEEDWGSVQECIGDSSMNPKMIVGFGNDYDGHDPITSVVDLETGNKIKDVMKWAREKVWVYVNNYSN